MYLATAWVVSVMLPPMAIFFPIVQLLEDFGTCRAWRSTWIICFKKPAAHGQTVHDHDDGARLQRGRRHCPRA